MTVVLHVIDAATDETSLQVLAMLRARLSSDDIRHEFCAIDGRAARRASQRLDVKVHLAAQRFVNAANFAPGLARFDDGSPGRVIHAWGIEAAKVAHTRLREFPLVVTLLDPATTEESARWVRSFPHRAIVAAGSQVIRARCLTVGIAPDRVAVIRGAVDFGAVNKARQAGARTSLAGDGAPVILMNGPPSRGGGQYYGLWAAAIVAQMHRGVRVLMPYPSRESQRLQRFARQIDLARMLIVPPENTNWPELVAAADVFLAAPVDEICTESLAWAMAGGVPIVATAVRSVAELIADRHNGLLCKPSEPRALAARILTALEDGELRRRVTDTARAQAYEVFGMRDFAENYQRLYANALEGRDAAAGVVDTAVVGAS